MVRERGEGGGGEREQRNGTKGWGGGEEGVRGI